MKASEAKLSVKPAGRVVTNTMALSSGYYDAYYGSAQKVRTLISRDFAAAFEQADVLALSWTLPTTAASACPTPDATSSRSV